MKNNNFISILLAVAAILGLPSCFNSNQKEQVSYPSYASYSASTDEYSNNNSSRWSGWSAWSTEWIPASPDREVETRTNTQIIGYNMVHYGTQEAEYPYTRMFRDYSIAGNLSGYRARDSYGEKQLTKYVSSERFRYASCYPANGKLVSVSYNGETYAGYQKGTKTAYNFGDDKYVWYVDSAVTGTVTEYRYRTRY